MANLGDLKFGVKVDKNSLNSATLDIKKQMQQAGNDVENSIGNGVKNGTEKAKKNIDGLQDSLKSVGKVLLGVFAVDKIIDFGKGIITLASNLQQAQISFTTMLGSGDKAGKLLKDLSDFAKNTPFELVGIRENAKQLLAMGVAQENLIPTMKSLGDVAAGLSVPLDRLALAYGQVLSKGRLQGDDLRQFTEAGVPLLDELSKNLGKSKGEITKLIEAGQVSAKEVTKAFMTMSSEGGRFANLMDAQSKTVAGKWSNLQDSLNSLGEKIGTQFLPLLSDVADGTLDIVNQYGDSVGTILVDTVTTFTSIIGDFITSFNSAFAELTESTSQAGNNQITFGKILLGVFSTIVAGIQAMVLVFKTFGGAVGFIIYYVIQRLSNFGVVIRSFVSQVSGMFKVVGHNIGVAFMAGINEAIKGINAMIGLINKIPGVNIGTIGSLGPNGGFQEFAQWQSPMEGFKEKDDAISKQLGEGWKDYTNGVIADFTKMSENISARNDKIFSSIKSTAANANNIPPIDLSKILGSSADPSKKKGKSSGEKLAEEEQKVAVDKLKASYSELQKKKGELAKAEEEYKNASVKYNEEIQNSIRKIGKELEANQKKYDEQVKQINLDAKNQNKSTTEDFLRSQAEKQVELENEGKQIQKNIDLARQEGRYDDTIQLLKDQEANATKLKDVKENIANVTKSEGIDVQKILDVERQRAALTDEKKNAFDFNTKLAQTEADRKQKEEQAKKDFEAEKLKLQRQQEIYEFFQSKKQLGIVELENFQKTEKFKNMSQEEQDLVLKLAKEKIELQQKRDDRIRAEQEVADATTDLSNKTTEVLKTNVSKLSLEYKNLIAEIKNALEAQKQLNAAASKARTGFAEGGYTGDGGVNDVAGVVHKGEYVVPNSMLTRIPGLLPALEAQRVGNYDYSRKVEISGPINMNQAIDFELLLEKAKFRM